ncbi:hypothetical protein Cgig2_005916 [Carnegiea gigantea]|uniref:Uncharacterized protein n=1 Tax=Carnegiea gigantea TaxID=171969 RepID=A0A9Q1JW82_9CARY|nr:hypothetical protein Cgig2_005916 [Carnegiea gigantea]
MAEEHGNCITVPTMTLDGYEGQCFSSPHNDPLDCLKKCKHLGREIIPLVHPILGFRGQDENRTRVIRLPLQFGDKSKARNLEVDFLVVDVPAAYNIILEWPTLHKIKMLMNEKGRKRHKEEREKYRRLYLATESLAFHHSSWRLVEGTDLIAFSARAEGARSHDLGVLHQFKLNQRVGLQEVNGLVELDGRRLPGIPLGYLSAPLRTPRRGWPPSLTRVVLSG